ncbi:hypothetical protein HYV86_07755 [Candidatus Woesearchaeota archaeon]|nr:hypothetical protein [Candidatus Woesearchaeota archaeon]
MSMPIKAKCRVCGQFAPPEQFKLHFELRQMVCPNCFSGKKKPADEAKEKEEAQKKMPPGWDKEDEYLEKMAAKKKESPTLNAYTRVPGADHYMCRCPVCKYQFKYDPVKKIPARCPYCGADLPAFKSFSLM